MKICLQIFICFLITIQVATALKCWRCINAKSEEECKMNGTQTICTGKEDACQVEVRYEGGWGIGQKITKRCKQAMACENNFNQNSDGELGGRQCNPKSPTPVCRCCCETANCNKDALMCYSGLMVCDSSHLSLKFGSVKCSDGKNAGSVCTFSCNSGFRLFGSRASSCDSNMQWDNVAPTCKPTTCPSLTKLFKNGNVKCSRSNNFQSKCRFSCNSGYEMSGFQTSTCTESGRWSHSPPKCHSKACKAIHTNFKYGSVSCSRGNQMGSMCRFSCDSGYTLEGEGFSTCTPDLKWDSATPSCKPVLCFPKLSSPMHGSMKCSLGNKYRSICRFTCNKGYAVDGWPSSTCFETGEWSTSAPECRNSICPPDSIPKSFENGFITCSNGNNVGSVCGFACDDGYTLSGDGFLTCSDDLTWDNSTPKCDRTRCFGTLAPPMNGTVKCSFGNKYSSKCRFECNSGYKLAGSAVSTCLRNGEWSTYTPKCATNVCGSNHLTLENGLVSCSSGVEIGSVCEFACRAGYTLDGVGFLTCTSDLSWDKDAPTCKPVKCPPTHDSFAHGSVKCTKNNEFESTCKFVCDEGYEMRGDPQCQCKDDAKWHPSMPVCVASECDTAIFSLDFGSVSCTDGSMVESTCTFECDDGYTHFGSKALTCGTNKKWDNSMPECRPTRCFPGHATPKNGSMICTDDVRYPTQCTFSCDPGHQMHGYTNSTCNRGKWSTPPPLCQKLSCPMESIDLLNGIATCSENTDLGSVCKFKCDEFFKLYGSKDSQCALQGDGHVDWDSILPICQPDVQCEQQERMPHGRLTCSDGSNVTSQCKFECTTKLYTLFPAETTENVCLGNSKWSRPTPCCARPCPPYALMDFVLVLDSSSSIGNDNWVKMIAFLQDFMDDFLVRYDGTNFGVLRYNGKVDEENQILLKDFPNDIDQILKRMGELPYQGSGTLTGKALKHAREVMFTKKNGNRKDIKDVLLVITDGMSQDPVGEAARALRADGIQTYVLPVKPRRGLLDLDQVREIAGSDHNMIMAAAEVGFQALTSEFSKDLGEIICGDPCDHAAPETPLDRLVAFGDYP